MQLREAHEPYYISFTDESVERVSTFIAALGIQYSSYVKFKHLPLSKEDGQKLISMVPLHEQLDLWAERVSLFITPPRTYYRAHKDGFDLRFGINYPIQIRDDLAITRWYDDEDVDSRYVIAPDGKKSREVIGFNPLAVRPTCSFTMKPDEMVMLNVDRYHDFHNRSKYSRVILTFRSRNLNLGFEDVAQVFRAQACTSPAR